jgi:hypothetical protein
MLTPAPIFTSFTKKVLASILLVGAGVFALASMGGGGSKEKGKTVKPEFTPIRTTNGFTLKAGPVYHGSFIIGQEKNKNYISLHSIVTYQKGNTTYIIPSRYKVQSSAPQTGSSLQMFNLKIKMHK